MAFCSNCGNGISDMAVACPSCGHPGPGAAGAVRTAVSAVGQAYAGWGQRALAAIIDWIVIAIPAYVIMAIFSFGLAASSRLDASDRVLGGASIIGGFLLGIIFMLGVGIAYRVLMEGGERGQTLGKMALNIQVRDANVGGPIGYGRAFIRWLVGAILWMVLYIPGIVDLLFPLWDPKHQTIHDKAASSVVVQVSR